MANLTSETLSKANGISKHNGAKRDGGNKIHSAEQKLKQISYGEDEDAFRGQNYVEANPTKGILIATAVGMAAGSLLTMALRRRTD